MDKAFFTANRHRLASALALAEGDMLVSFSGLPRRRSADESYPFFANRNFVYLTGLEQQDLVYLAWLEKGEVREKLFLPPADAFHERWYGRMLRTEQAKEKSGLGDIAERESFERFILSLIDRQAAPRLFLDFDAPKSGLVCESSQNFAQLVRTRRPFCRAENMHPALQRLRAIKAPQEIAQLRQSISATKLGIDALIAACRPGMYEYELRAVFEKALIDKGVRHLAFDTIVAAGKNALVMHYPEQDARVREGDMVLLDLGARAGLLCADISRMFPVSGEYTPRQRALCQASRGTIEYLCDKLKCGMLMSDIDPLGDEYLAKRLREMGLLSEGGSAAQYRWHRISHHLGFDTHDDCDYSLPIAPGMVFTMEVGIYVPEWGEGVRIEDDILMTEAGCENLSL